MCSCFLTGLGWLASTTIGGLITYLYTRHHDKSKDYKEARNKLNATVNRYIKDAQKIIKGVEQGEFPAV